MIGKMSMDDPTATIPMIGPTPRTSTFDDELSSDVEGEGSPFDPVGEPVIDVAKLPESVAVEELEAELF